MGKFTAYKRIVIFQPRNAWVCDLGAGSALTPRFNTSEDRFDTAAGTRKPVARSRQLVIPVFDETKLAHLRVMWKEGCEIRAILLGGGSNIVWELDSEFNLVEFGGGPGQVTGANIELETDLFSGSIYQSHDLLSGIPWDCEDATLSGGTYYLPGPSGWLGNKWVVSSGDTVDEFGLFVGSGAPQLEMYFPVQGAAFTLGGTFTGNIKTLDHSGATLTTTAKGTAGVDVTGTIDSGTWKIQINVTTASTRPQLTITDPGSLASDRVGECVDCSDPDAVATSTPAWSS